MEKFMEPPLQRLRQARERRPNYREVLDLAERMLIEKCRPRDEQPSSSPLIDPVKAKRNAAKGIPYLRFPAPFLHASRVVEYFSCLLKRVRSFLLRTPNHIFPNYL
jgi:hypothetical protein